MLQSFLRCTKKTAPSFVSASGNRANSVSSLSVSAPSNIQDDDLLVAIFYAGGVNTSSLPSGFTSAYQENTTNPKILIGWKYASSESGSYTFTASASANISAAVLVYRNAIFDVVGTINRGTSTSTATALSITATSSGILIASFSIAQQSATVSTNPSGMTQQLNITNATNASTVYVYDQSLISSGATSNKSAVFNTTGIVSGIQISIK